MSAMCVLNKNLKRGYAVVNLRTRKFVSFPRSLGLNLIYLISFNRSSCFFDRLPVLLINTTDILDCLFLLQ